jgi:hypothetical protein
MSHGRLEVQSATFRLLLLCQQQAKAWTLNYLLARSELIFHHKDNEQHDSNR